MQALGAAWGTWMEKFRSAIVLGDGLKRSGRLLKTGIVSDGPYVETKEIIASFTVIQADGYDAALAIARECPGYNDARWPGYSIEIREMFGFA
jgi:hypothetical protein